ncbi:ketose-bisphosphate aldolase [Sulfobacillus thermosulfidooxidans DSM 9293]|uniref:Ketose-bisphosphate aldolase n=2 Tax=Sulfobacillus thermosulfidooxidans TaxID=28034 RepID=A0A1W1WPI3_SULTA|nr:ketose-bisphosphate aldolase [Sulfobacillus thermosulfidooxidans DSM 9293]
MARHALRDILADFARTQRVLLGINADNPEMLLGIAQALHAEPVPMFIQLTPETLSIWGYDVLTTLMSTVLDPLPSPISWHLDHATALEDVQQALAWGFTSVMYDGSALPFAENVRQTQQVVQWAHARGVLVEAEIGHVSKPGEPPEWAHLTSPEEAVAFVEATDVDALAVAIGNHHATHVAGSHIDVARLAAIHAVCPVPLVLHGASGVSQDMYDTLRTHGIAKMNFGTELRRIWWQTVHQLPDKKPRDVQREIQRLIGDGVREKIHQLSLAQHRA